MVSNVVLKYFGKLSREIWKSYSTSGSSVEFLGSNVSIYFAFSIKLITPAAH